VKKIVLILAVIVMLITAGCIKIEMSDQDTTSTQSETVSSSGMEIISFTASPDSIKPGESVTLSWEVSGADEADISPEVGPVKPSGLANVNPEVTTTYVLSAEGMEDSINKSVTVYVDESEVSPDLVITDVFIRVKSVYFTVKNIGTEKSPGCRAYLYLDGTKITDGDTYIDPLDPGEERTLVFGKYEWINPMETENLPLPLPKLIQWEIKVCADAADSIGEASEKNNCKSLIMGQEFDYSFYEKAHLAKWTTGDGKLTWPVPEGNKTGSAFTMESKVLEDNRSHAKILGTYPQQVANGWISGTFYDFYTNELRQPAERLMEIPRHCKFTADVGFIKEAPAAAKAKFIFMILDQGGMPVYSKELIASRNGSLDSFDEDLTELAGITGTIVLRVESQGSPGDIMAVWADPRLTQNW
jgi:hypothetical protein